MLPEETVPTTPNNFLALPPPLGSLEQARVVVLPVPYDSTVSYRSGARDGPAAIIAASRHLEDYDQELGCEPCQVGIYTAPEIEPHMGSPEAMVERVAQTVAEYAEQGKLVATLGGEHTITVGAVRGVARRYRDLSVLYLDAHADLRESYLGARYCHATAARRVLDTSPIVEVGVRSLSAEERRFIDTAGIPVFIYNGGQGLKQWEKVIERLSPHVYVSVDLDVLDPSVMPCVGTPAAGGMGWYELLDLLRRVAREREIVGMDVVELAPEEGPVACAALAAQLVYKLIGYATVPGTGRS